MRYKKRGKMNLANVILASIIFLCSFSEAGTRNYITGHGFKACADYVVESEQCLFNPAKVQARSIIFVKVDYVRYFFKKIFPKINNPIILITHNGDYSAPGKCAEYLDDPRIIAWFGQNCDVYSHPKFIPIPIGIANAEWRHGNTAIFDAVLDYLMRHPHKKKLSKLYINFEATHPIRTQLRQLFHNKSFVEFASVKPPQKYLLEMSRYKFVLSPQGNGLDCHRTWEALLMGAIPVMKTSTLDSLYEGLPVIIVQDWDDITEEFLERKYQEIQTTTYNREKLFMNYWVDLIYSPKNSQF